jgi:Fe-S-cluster containining protein
MGAVRRNMILTPRTDPMSDESPPLVTINLEFTIGDQRVQAQIPVPSGPARPRIMLPVLHALGDLVVGQAIKTVEKEGAKISCKAGCGACCRQLVPITPTEAYQIRALVEKLPEPRRTEIRTRFADAHRRLEEAGLLDTLRHPEQIGEDHRKVGMEVFNLGIPCPFLQDESCSIYSERPLACREYLVTSPATECARPTAAAVRRVPVPSPVSRALADVGVTEESRYSRWVPLILAPEWVEAHPEEEPTRPGPEILREIFDRLCGQRRPS